LSLLVLLLGQGDPSQLPAPPGLPDFTGHWVLINPADAPPEVARDLRITQTGSSITAVGTPAGSLPSGTFTVGIIGGSVTPAARTRNSARVVDGRLVFQFSFEPNSSQPGTSTVRSEEWSLAGDRLTIQLSERRDDRLTLDVTVVYRRDSGKDPL
jgi:hypothetical protein